ncbi:restriction endonuclease subunit S [Allochromatium humboldtianum]|nr:restriction endonuclease subunit S [Allochromatium humboldtianum]
MGDWCQGVLGDILELKRGYDLPQKKRCKGSFPLVSSSGVTDYHAEAMVKGPGVITGRYGTLGEVFYVDSDFWPLNTTLYVRDFKGNDQRFISYFLRHLDFSAYSDKAAVPGLNRNHLHQAPIAYPVELEEQVAIADLLSTLDDKIELNCQTNATLEAMARALFKDWFVDFGPTRAKAEGRTPYLAPHIWEFFPDALDDEDKPVGWTIEPLLDHARLISGGTPKTDVTAYWHGPIAWASAKDVSQCSDAFLIETERSITPRGLEESSTRLIPKNATVVVARGATTGRYCLFGSEMAMNQTCYALASLNQWPFWLNCAFGFVVQELVHSAHGSVFDTITTKTIQQARITIADQKLIDSFEETVTLLFNRIHSNLEESRTLAQIRDLLLPKLMSGEIRLREAERIVEAVL